MDKDDLVNRIDEHVKAQTFGPGPSGQETDRYSLGYNAGVAKMAYLWKREAADALSRCRDEATVVAWIVQAKDDPNSPRYLQWEKEGIGLLQQHQCNHTPLYARAIKGADEATVAVPRELTSENGAKAALMGEFFFQPYEDSAPVAIPWTKIKEIHRAVVLHFAAAQGEGKP